MVVGFNGLQSVLYLDVGAKQGIAYLLKNLSTISYLCLLRCNFIKSFKFILRDMCWVHSQTGKGGITYGGLYSQFINYNAGNRRWEILEHFLKAIYFYILREIYITYNQIVGVSIVIKLMSKDQEQRQTSSSIIQRTSHFSQRQYQFSEEQQLILMNNLQKKFGKILNLQQITTIAKRIGLISIFCFIIFHIVIIDSYVNQNHKLEQKIQRIESKTADMQEQINYLKKVIQNHRQDINANKKYTERLANQIIDLNMNQLVQSEKSIQFIQKHSAPIIFQYQENVKSFRDNYRLNKKKQSIRKTTNQQGIMVYSLNPIPSQSISYFKIKIEYTEFGMISIGVFTQQKLRSNIDCGYCQGNQMYYIYCKNGQVYHGQTLQYYKHSKKSRISRIKVGDIVSLFIDQQQNQLTWYVNEKYVFSQYLEEKLVGEQLYPFVVLGSLNDEVTILT